MLTISSGAWIILPTYMIYVSGSEILQGLAVAAGGDEKNEWNDQFIMLQYFISDDKSEWNQVHMELCCRIRRENRCRRELRIFAVL